MLDNLDRQEISESLRFWERRESGDQEQVDSRWQVRGERERRQMEEDWLRREVLADQVAFVSRELVP